MEQHIVGTGAIDRRGFVSMAGMGTLAAFVPQPLWALAGAKYPTIQSKIDAYVAAKKDRKSVV